METSGFIWRLINASAAGLLIGSERQIYHKATGLKTNLLVSTGAAVFVLLSFIIIEDKGYITKIAGQAFTGVGFLGASGLLIEILFCAVLVVGDNTIIGSIEKRLRNRK